MTEENGENSADRLDRALETIDAGKREYMKKIVAGTIFMAPVVASFAIDGLSINPAFAVSNSTAS